MRNKKLLIANAPTLILVLITSLISLLRDDYNHLNQSFSELGMLYAPYYLVFNLFAFVLVGMMSLYFWNNIVNQLPMIDFRKGTIELMVVASIGWIGTGIFPLSYQIDWLYIIHIAFAFSAFLFAGIGMISIGLQLNNTSGYEVFGFVSVLTSIFMWSAIFTSGYYLTMEMGQLTSISIYFIWQSGLSFVLLKT